MEKKLPFSEIKTSADTVIYELHWPDDYAKVPAHGKPRPKHPPTVWPGVLSSRSHSETHMPPPRTTSRASLVVQNAQPGEPQEFFDRDSVTFSALEEDIRENRFPDSQDITALRRVYVIIFRSRSFSNGVP